MREKFLEKPQFLMLALGGWLFLFGLTGAITYSEPEVATIQETITPSTNNRIKVVPSNQRPGAVSNQLQGAQNLQTQGSEDLQQQGSGELQPNSGLSNFPSGNSNQLQ